MGVLNTVLRGFTTQGCIHKWYLHTSQSWEISYFPQAWQHMTSSMFGQMYKKIIKGFKVNVFAFEELCFSPSGPPLLPFAGTSPSLPYTCLFIFSFFSSFKIPRVCCGPESCSWSSANLERSSAFLEIWGGRRHEIGCKPRCINPQVVYTQPTCAAGLVLPNWKWSGTSNAKISL